MSIRPRKNVEKIDINSFLNINAINIHTPKP